MLRQRFQPAAILLAFAALIILAVNALAFDQAILGQAERAAASLRQDIQAVQGELALPTVSSDQLLASRRKVEEIRTSALTHVNALNGPYAEVDVQLKSLGPVPESGTEATEIADQRNALTAMLTRIKTAQGQLGLIVVESEQLATRISQMQQDRFFERIFEVGRSIFNWSLWYDGAVGASVFVQRLGGLIANWWSDIATTANPGVLVLVPIVFAVLFLLYRGARRWFTRRFGGALRQRRVPDDTDRLWRIFRGVLFTTIVTAAIVITLYFVFQIGGIMTPRFDHLYSAIADFIFFPIFMGALAYRIAAPRVAAWRIVDVSDGAAQRFAGLAFFAALLSAGEEFFAELSEFLFLPPSFIAGQGAVSATLMIVTIAAAIMTLRNQPGLPAGSHQGRLYFNWTKPLVPVLWLLVLVAAVALALGYIRLAGFIGQQVIDTAFILAGLFIVHHLSDAVVASAFDPNSTFGQILRRITGLGERGVARLGLIFRTVFDLALIVFGVPLVLLKWTVTWVDFGSWVNTAFIGVQIGDINISLSNVLLLLVILAVGWGITKLFAGWLNTRVLSQTQIDKGVRDSVTKGATYTGYILAAAFALTAAGLDFSNFALIAGALGVGIGFGLQSIVSNFVSGLILLAERPIKAGDWVEVKGGSGLVKQINVRATEIETFDASTIIVPNSLLISEPVLNYTHRDSIGRFKVRIPVALGSDPVKVKELMLAAAKNHALVLFRPEPAVVLSDVSEKGYTFDLFAHVGDVMRGGGVASDIRFAILEAFKQAGIDLPMDPAMMRVVPPRAPARSRKA
jgi:potassium-dependent mechanosensitive channel